jgi:hypothetical protein
MRGLTEPRSESLSELKGPEAVFLFVVAALWVVAGIAMLLWPARVRALTVPDWRRYEKWGRWSGTALIWYRFTGLVLMLIGGVTIYAVLMR